MVEQVIELRRPFVDTVDVEWRYRVPLVDG